MEVTSRKYWGPPGSGGARFSWDMNSLLPPAGEGFVSFKALEFPDSPALIAEEKLNWFKGAGPTSPGY